jgi:hypothetical protein
MSADEPKPELTMLGNLSDMTEDELIDSIIEFIEGKMSSKEGD